MEYSPVACIRQSSRCWLSCNFSLARAPGTNLASQSSFGTTSVSLSSTVARASTTPWPGSTCWLPLSSTGIRPSRRSGQAAETRRADRRARPLSSQLTSWVGPHPAHRRIPMAKAPIATLAYDSDLYRNRPEDIHSISTSQRKSGEDAGDLPGLAGNRVEPARCQHH